MIDIFASQLRIKQQLNILTDTIMSATFKNQMRDVMTMAWQFVKRNGYSMSEALKTAWRNITLKKELSKRIVKFYFQKVNGDIREAFGTLASDKIPAIAGTDNRKRNDTVQVYFDTVKGEWRCFKIANLIKIA